MSENQTMKQVRIPGPDHPITIARGGKRVVVKSGGQIIADTRQALTLQEASYPPVFYIPRADVSMSLLQRSQHTTHCPFKGDAAYYSITSGGDRTRNAVWTYEHPHEAVAAIKDHLAFYPSKVDAIEESPAG